MAKYLSTLLPGHIGFARANQTKRRSDFTLNFIYPCFYLNPVKAVMQETDKMSVERLDEFIGFTIAGTFSIQTN
jgi:hypothetical protein